MVGVAAEAAALESSVRKSAVTSSSRPRRAIEDMGGTQSRTPATGCHRIVTRSPQRFLSADGLCTASPPDFSLLTRYCGSSLDALTLRPAASVSEVILCSTRPLALEPCEFHWTLSPFLKSAMSADYRSGD